ncbi:MULTISPECIES: carboxypeptidase M32 [Halocynthiibacter]|uniref:Metal-dependent carboxypeptidase n=1 Tax=Halocynthiibacter halioticoli TaxID=2986804 RepID=A0AAE3LR73_9RHOB|nr:MULTISPECIES: carboxypeptidase M32 [Halocynthiibacter]MCV6824293.1 carboxypeptidase M32 [Halocynthiibacter halioticoli]MCW4057294.1 carboxypeptidase M32 [Halocynthiibacter sp. SDUM655004]
MGFVRETCALGEIAGRLGWDQETMMAPGSAPQRAEEMAAMESVLHARKMDARVGEWLDALEGADIGEVEAAQLRLIRREFDRATKVPAKLASEIARVTSAAQGIWAEARAAENFADFAPTLEKVVALRREEADALAQGGDRYDALLQDYEPGTSAAEISTMFDNMRPRLVALRERILGSEFTPVALTRDFDIDAQMSLSNELAIGFGYDFTRGRLDKAVHPFSSGSGNDVRITTRTAAQDPFNCIYSTIHEVGHACYEQNISQDYLLTPLGRGVSMGVHESQSRIYENQIGRSAAYTSYLFAKMKDAFGDIGVADAEAFFATVNRVRSGYIRTEADEIHYNLHVMLRFDLEQQLISGALDVADLPDAWNTRFESDFGVAVDKPSNGCLQDVHWSVGLFGYFPTYSLGNLYAGCLNEAMHAAEPGLDAEFAKGDTSRATAWLAQNVQQHGGRYTSADVITRACGKEPSEAPLLAYLEEKFGRIYNL